MTAKGLTRFAVVAGLAAGLSACGWFSDSSPPPQRVQPPPAEDAQRGYPNLGTVPARPQTSTAADRAAAAGQLSSDRARARYGDEAQPVDETRGATIGSTVRPKPPEADKPGTPEEAPVAKPPKRAQQPPGSSPAPAPQRSSSVAPAPAPAVAALSADKFSLDI